MMDIEFGVGLRKFLFEMNSESTYDEIGAKITQQTERYMPFLDIIGIRFLSSDEGIDNSTVTVRVRYEIVPMGVEDIVAIDAVRVAAAMPLF